MGFKNSFLYWSILTVEEKMCWSMSVRWGVGVGAYQQKDFNLKQNILKHSLKFFFSFLLSFT